MKRLPHLLTVASVAVVPVLTADRAANASDKQTLDIGLNTVANGRILLAQNSVPKEAKGSDSAKVNVDGNGVILKHYHPIGHKNSSCALGLEPIYGRLFAESV